MLVTTAPLAPNCCARWFSASARFCKLLTIAERSESERTAPLQHRAQQTVGSPCRDQASQSCELLHRHSKTRLALYRAEHLATVSVPSAHSTSENSGNARGSITNIFGQKNEVKRHFHPISHVVYSGLLIRQVRSLGAPAGFVSVHLSVSIDREAWPIRRWPLSERKTLAIQSPELVFAIHAIVFPMKVSPQFHQAFIPGDSLTLAHNFDNSIPKYRIAIVL